MIELCLYWMLLLYDHNMAFVPIHTMIGGAVALIATFFCRWVYIGNYSVSECRSRGINLGSEKNSRT